MSTLRVNEIFRGERTPLAGLSVAPVLHRFVDDELLPVIDCSPDAFWRGTARLVHELSPENRRLIARRDELQARIDAWLRARAGAAWEQAAYVAFLDEIGYLEPMPDARPIDPVGVDREIAAVAAPQLVVPLSNPRFAVNAANARWGSLFDALYGSDAVAGRPPAGAAYDPLRGAAVIARAVEFLDLALPLEGASHAQVAEYRLARGAGRRVFRARLRDGGETGLVSPCAFAGTATRERRQVYLLCHHGLHLELHCASDDPVGRDAPGHLCDIVVEAALTTIQDCEDSVAAVDPQDKVEIYRNWLALMRGDLVATFEKGGETRTRRLAADRRYVDPDGQELVLPGRSLMLVRNAGLHTTSSAILDRDGEEVFEGILDAIVTVGCALANRARDGWLPNSAAGSIYVVKPKLHGSAEAAFTDALFARVEALYGLAPNTVKLGLMDEERRTTVNLPACIQAMAGRIAFINTGFLDRTGDEIRTSTYAGVVPPKARIKEAAWLSAYEDWNVDVGLAHGFAGRAQIGKGMWPKPDEMREMLATKDAHPQAGASCAWVPSPTAATLHAMHYHAVCVRRRQAELAERTPVERDALLVPALCDPSALEAETVRAELDANVQGILGYVVRWIDQGVGCSKVPDIHGVGLMEDRATLRISSQHIANWLLHGVIGEAEVRETLRRMAAVVDEQNARDPGYVPMTRDLDSSIAFAAACDLIFAALEQPNGYTEPLLHRHRLARKAAAPG